MNVPTLQSGIDWRFETFPEYLDALRSCPSASTSPPSCPHSMVRLYVMGADAAFSRPRPTTSSREICRRQAEALARRRHRHLDLAGPVASGPARQARAEPLRRQARARALLETLAENRRAASSRSPTVRCSRSRTSPGSRPSTACASRGARCSPASSAGRARPWPCSSGASSVGGQLWPQTSTRYITTQMSMENPYQWSRVPAFAEVLGRGHDVDGSRVRGPRLARPSARADRGASPARPTSSTATSTVTSCRTSVEETDVPRVGTGHSAGHAGRRAGRPSARRHARPRA